MNAVTLGFAVVALLHGHVDGALALNLGLIKRYLDRGLDLCLDLGTSAKLLLGEDGAEIHFKNGGGK
uniref:Uncharacterized protein n=1 Tax=viral metagenome TaxID=1070528 RepID=A0A6C0JJ80_9ZZZZ